MSNRFVSVLRQPDAVFSATEKSPFRFEERATATADVKFDYIVTGNSAKIMVYPSGSPVKYIQLRFRGDMRIDACTVTTGKDAATVIFLSGNRLCRSERSAGFAM